MKSKPLLISVLLYVVGAIGDNLLTYWFVVVKRDFYEANPFTAERIYSQPLWMWFVYDALGFAFALMLALGYYRFMTWLSRNDPPARRARILKIASRYWVIPLIVAVARLLPVIHNVMLVCFGYESPLSNIAYELGKFMGVAP